MTLSDTELRRAMRLGSLLIEPTPAEKCFQPSSIDLHLGNEFSFYNQGVRFIDVSAPPLGHLSTVRSSNITLTPLTFALAVTEEFISLGPQLVGRVEGKSSIGRLGLFVHVTAGYVDPGYHGRLTLELFNASPVDLYLTAGMAIAQLSCTNVLGKVERPYGHDGLNSHYQGDLHVQESKGLT